MAFCSALEDVDYRPAQRRLKGWLKGQGLGIVKALEWAKWGFNNRPFWSAWVVVYGIDSFFCETWGMQIYDDGDIVLVTKLQFTGGNEI